VWLLLLPAASWPVWLLLPAACASLPVMMLLLLAACEIQSGGS
jgi:hypothetical protein